MEHKKCIKCKISKPVDQFSKDISAKDKLYHYCKICSNEKIRASLQKWRDKNNGGYPDSMRKYKSEYYKNKRKNDPNYLIANRLKNAIWRIFKRNSKSKKVLFILGVKTRQQFVDYIYNQLTDEMRILGHGMNGWCIDHIEPISNFDLSKEAELLECFNYKNLRPLLFKENCRKYNKKKNI